MLRRNFQMRQETHRGRHTHQRRRIYRSSYHSGTYYNESDAELIVTFLDAAFSPYQEMVTGVVVEVDPENPVVGIKLIPHSFGYVPDYVSVYLEVDLR